MSETILIVDDTPANLGVLVETLGAAGYQLMVAEDGEEALAQTAQTQPDLILLDVMMPGLDGFETCRQLKARAITRDIPVLFMTALSEITDKMKAFAAGGVDYITKPIEHEEALARVRTHLALRRLQRQLEEQLALKDKFMRIASHDLRNPLFMIIMAGELAKRQPGMPADAAKYLDSIAESATHMCRVIDTFLQLKRSDATRVDLNLVAAGAVSQQQVASVTKNIRIVVQLGEDLPPVHSEPAHAFQAVTNFLSNALKFTPRGGTITLHSRLSGRHVRCEIHDTGPGVPTGERDQLFREHGHLTPKPTAGEESHGVGLAIVKHLVESQGGAVGADFPAGGGSVFWFELPVA
jgi:signal transduction histidine kinase